MKNKLLAITLASLLMTVGCSAAWLSTFDGYLKIAGPILIQVLDIVSLAKGIPVNAQLVSKINSDQAAVTALANSVSSAAAQNLQGTCAQFNLGVETFASDLASIEQIAQITDPTKQAEVATLVQLASQTIAEVEAPITACQTAPTATAARARLEAAVLKISSPEDVVKRFNALVDAKHRIHYHGKFVRMLSFGKLQ